MLCYTRNFPGGRHNQGWRKGLISTKCGEDSQKLERVNGGLPRIREFC